MRKTIYVTLAIFLLTVFSCQKDCSLPEPESSMMVVRDCTGTYLRINGKDYRVCNLEKVEPFADGSKVVATFIKIDPCNGSAKDAVICYMLHPNEGWIEVTSIR